jgi:hypothetical protein
MPDLQHPDHMMSLAFRVPKTSRPTIDQVSGEEDDGTDDDRTLVEVIKGKRKRTLMRTSLLCIQCKDRSLEHVRDSWISRYVLTLSIVFQNLLGSMHVLLIRNNGEDQQGLGEGEGVKEEELERPHQGGVHVQLDFDSTSDSRT